MAGDVVERWFACTRRVAAAGGPTTQARARSDRGEPIAAKARVPRAVCVTPLPARILAVPDVDVTRRRQGRRDGLASSGNGHGDGRTGTRGPAVGVVGVVVW